MYKNFLKRVIDFILSLLVLIVLSPVLLILTMLGAIKMKGNPFFTQRRPGKDEKIFKMIKFRTMTSETDAAGNLLPDEQRLTRYGELLRSTSLDELPELINILKGDMSFVGPRPLAVVYLPYYTAQERKRHSVRPGLSGWAQVNGRNALSWEKKFELDVWYAENISFWLDVKTVFLTVVKVFKREGIGQGEARPVSLHVERAEWVLDDDGAKKPEVTV